MENSVIENLYIDDVFAVNNSLGQFISNTPNLRTIAGSFSNASSITTLWEMCCNCPSLEVFDIDMTNMLSQDGKYGNTFKGCSNLKYISPFPTSTVDFADTFTYASSLTDITLLSTEGSATIFEKLASTLTYWNPTQKLTIHVPANSNAYNYYTSAFSKITFLNKATVKAIDDVPSNAPVVACYGDSITEITTDSYLTYSLQLCDMLKDEYIVLNRGVSSDLSWGGAYRSGAYKLFVDRFTIPSSADDSVEISITGEMGGKLPPKFPKVKINGVAGTITVSTDGGSNVYSFKRDCDGNEEIVEKDTVIEMVNDVSTELSQGDILVVHLGTNDLQTTAQITNQKMVDDVINNIRAIINRAGTDRYIVCGITTADRYNSDNSTYYEDRMEKAFCNHFINTREYFLENAYDIVGKTPDDTAIEEMAKGQVPSVFKGDKLHINKYGAKVLASAINDKINELSYKTDTPTDGHKFVDFTENPSCYQAGYNCKQCSICGYETQKVLISTVDHDFSDNAEFCRFGCGTENPDYVIPHDHIFSNYVDDNNATCTTDGTKTAKCDFCKATDTIINSNSATGHTVVIDEAKTATCTEDGFTEGSHCSVCNEVFVEQKTVPATGHNWTQWTITNPPSYCQDGLSIRICNDCNTIDRLVIPTTGTHRYVTVVTKATCTEKGYTTYTCDICNDSYTADYVDALGHSYIGTTTPATISADGKIVKKCSICAKTLSTTVIPKASSVKLSGTSYTYDGKVKTPTVTVKDRTGKKLVKSTDYTVSYASGRKNVGKYAVKITFKGKYSGTKTLYFTIKPKATSISSLTAKSKGFTVKWYKRTTQTSGYQVQYSTSSKFTSPKTVTISKTGTTSKQFQSLRLRKSIM